MFSSNIFQTLVNIQQLSIYHSHTHLTHNAFYSENPSQFARYTQLPHHSSDLEGAVRAVPCGQIGCALHKGATPPGSPLRNGYHNSVFKPVMGKCLIVTEFIR